MSIHCFQFFNLLRLAFPFLIAATVFPVNSRTPADNHLFIAAVVGGHSRDGYIDFGNNRIEHVSRQVMWSIGLSAGKNFGLPRGIRLSLPLQFDYGSAVDDTFDIPLDDGTTPPTALHSIMYHFGLEPLFQFPFRLAPKAWANGALGGGIHYISFIEEERIINDPARRRIVGDMWPEKSSGVSFSAATGGGIEFTLAPQISLYIQYLFRFWRPINRKTHRDLYPLDQPSVQYAERFFTHLVSAGIMFSRER